MIVAPTHCAAFNECDENSPTRRDFWRVFVDRNEPGTCTSNGTDVVGAKFFPLTENSGPPITWMTSTATPGTDAVRFWKLGATQPPLLQNRWAVQLRIPIASASGLSLQEGIDPNSTFWYQGSAVLDGDLYAFLGAWPRQVGEPVPVCPASGFENFLVHPLLGNTDNYSRLSRIVGDTPPPDCDKGITISSADIGAVFDAPPGADFATVPLTRIFRGLRPNGTPGTNTVIARPTTSSASITAPLMGRFRLASWGSVPAGTVDTGKWKDMRGAENGVCAAGSPPGCTPAPIPPAPIPQGSNVIRFSWTIGNDPTLGASEYCKFGLTPPGGSCVDCSCAGQPNCDVPTDQGTRAGAAPCVSKGIQHQCVLVELSAPNGDVDFVQQSAWNNMDFAQMSVVAREALIDARQLPVAKGQKYQDIYLIAMARNMPPAIAGGKQEGTAFLRERALVRAEVAADAYVKDVESEPGCEVCPIPVKAGLAPTFDERVQRVSRALRIMPQKDRARISGMLALASSTANAAALTEAAVATLGPDDAAGVAPTLEIYPFYQPNGRGAAYLPMTAFTVFLSHEGAMTGINWEIDGAKKIGENVYHLRIPVRSARKVRVRAEAIEDGTSTLDPNNPRWPCAGCCVPKNCGVVGQFGNALPGIFAGLYAVRRRRRRSRLLPRLPF